MNSKHVDYITWMKSNLAVEDDGVTEGERFMAFIATGLLHERIRAAMGQGRHAFFDNSVGMVALAAASVLCPIDFAKTADKFCEEVLGPGYAPRDYKPLKTAGELILQAVEDGQEDKLAFINWKNQTRMMPAQHVIIQLFFSVPKDLSSLAGLMYVGAAIQFQLFCDNPRPLNWCCRALLSGAKMQELEGFTNAVLKMSKEEPLVPSDLQID